ncbi:hypothetical protein [Solidesulfovibrio sp.]|uniref:hypothetical protein n=1 Tax=Solidesulfovibrio sp. TaxID=2910990 RepID=UPI00263479C9|nr:hypothetical protein [Solidesulfovibrio sp.]
MTATEAAATETVAWNGLRLPVPADWRPTRLGLGYLYFEDDDGPAFEFKWRAGAGREGMEAALKALTPKGLATSGGELPPAWLDALADFELMPLSWRRDGRAGLGAALFCPECGLAAVFQAYGGQGGPDPARQAAVAAALAGMTHHDPGPPAFSLYGLSFAAPPGFVLAAFGFAPGRFSLDFAAPGRRLDVVRLAPADVLLAGASLADAAARTFSLEDGAVREEGGLAGCPAVWLARRQGTGLGQVLARRLGRPGRLAVLRHDAGANKLLGAALTAAVPVDRNWLAETAARCVSL